MRKLLTIVLLAAVIAVSGCVSKDEQYVELMGEVVYANSLEEAYEQCVALCHQKLADMCNRFNRVSDNKKLEAYRIVECIESNTYNYQARISLCANHVCQCEC
jgi:hypothetical protein